MTKPPSLGWPATARSATQRIGLLRKLRPSDIRLFVSEVKNRVTGRSMGEHTEDMAKTWNIGRQEQDELALQSHRRAVAARDRGFIADLIAPVDGITEDHFPRRDTSIEKACFSIFTTSLEKTVADWTRESRLWHKKFKAAVEKAQVGLEDQRTRAFIEQRALRLLHAV